MRTLTEYKPSIHRQKVLATASDRKDAITKVTEYGIASRREVLQIHRYKVIDYELEFWKKELDSRLYNCVRLSKISGKHWLKKEDIERCFTLVSSYKEWRLILAEEHSKGLSDNVYNSNPPTKAWMDKLYKDYMAKSVVDGISQVKQHGIDESLDALIKDRVEDIVKKIHSIKPDEMED